MDYKSKYLKYKKKYLDLKNIQSGGERNGFVTYIDGDRLDVYRSQREAEKAASEFMKQYKGMK